MKKTLLLTPLVLMLFGCPSIRTSQGQLVVAKTRSAIYDVDYTGTYGNQGLYYIYYTILAINDLSNITLSMRFLDKNKDILEITSKNVIDLASEVGQTVKFDYSSHNVFKIKYYQVGVIATATYY